MAEVIFFDNSALSRLVDADDVDRKALVAGLKTLGILRISALNVIETARTPDRDLRTRKLKFYKELTRTVAPMNVPDEVLALVARAYHDGTGTISAGDQFAYNLLTDPDSVTDELRAELTQRAKKDEKRFKVTHQQLREHFDAVFEGPDDRFDTETAFLDFTFANADNTLAKVVSGIYKEGTGVDLPPADVPEFLEKAVPIKVFIAAHLHILWTRAISQIGPGKKKAGVVDTDSAVYLNFSDRFITNDRPQFEAMTVANRFNPRNTRVELYDDLRGRLTL